jgi:hypothetical protein
MPSNPPRAIEKFPPSYHFPLLAGDGEYPIGVFGEKKLALREAEKYREFLKALKIRGPHTLLSNIPGKVVKTKIVRDGQFLNSVWVLKIIVKDKFDPF